MDNLVAGIGRSSSEEIERGGPVTGTERSSLILIDREMEVKVAGELSCNIRVIKS